MELYEKLWFSKANINIKTKLYILNKGISLKTLYNYNCEDFLNIGVSIKEFDKIDKAKDEKYINETIKYLEKENIKFIFYTDEIYPKILKDIYNPPIALL